MFDENDEKELNDYLERAKKEMFPKLKQSVMSLTILSKDPDPKLCLELGAAILFNKPIIIIAPKGVTVPPVLKTIANKVIEDFDPQNASSLDKLKAAVNSALLEREKHLSN